MHIGFEVLTALTMKSSVFIFLMPFSIQNGLKQGDASLPFLLNFSLEYAIMKDQE
jgi:hypothetical protein